MRSLLERLMQDYVHARNHEPFKGHPLLGTMRQLEEESRGFSFLQEYHELKVKGSIGQGNFATIPWLALMDTRITTTTQKGTYIVYLFSEDMERVYLTWNQGVTKIKKEYGVKKAREHLRNEAEKIIEQINLGSLEGFNTGTINLNTTSQDGKLYELGALVYKEYRYGELPEDAALERDLSLLVNVYKEYIENETYGAARGAAQKNVNNGENGMDSELQECIEKLHESITSEGFFYPYEEFAAFCLSLKTKPLALLAGISGTGKTRLVELVARQFGASDRTIAVRPDWNDSTDLLGYTDLEGKFRPGPLLEVLEEANRNPSFPYFICLDEMNLARVEHYFAEVLSTIEKRRLVSGVLITPPVASLQTSTKPWSEVYFSPNVFLVGTVNMDETTYPFSKKVLDRANTLEFNYINLDYKKETGKEDQHSSELNWEILKPEYCHLAQFYDKAPGTCEFIITHLKGLNEILEPGQFQVGYRVRDEICLFMVYAEQAGLERDIALDLQIAQKVLPRIQGSSAIVRKVLVDLWNWATADSLSADEMDLLAKVGATEGAPYPRCASKISAMLHRLELDGYTSFWV